MFFFTFMTKGAKMNDALAAYKNSIEVDKYPIWWLYAINAPKVTDWVRKVIKKECDLKLVKDDGKNEGAFRGSVAVCTRQQNME